MAVADGQHPAPFRGGGHFDKALANRWQGDGLFGGHDGPLGGRQTRARQRGEHLFMAKIGPFGECLSLRLRLLAGLSAFPGQHDAFARELQPLVNVTVLEGAGA